MMLFVLLLGSDPFVASTQLIEAEEAYLRGLEQQSDAAIARPLFAQSARAYEQLWMAGYRNADLAANRAQGYLMAGDLPNAIRAYRQGLRLAPANRRLRQGLDAARNQVIYPRGGSLEERTRPHEPFRVTHYLPPWLGFLFGFGFYAFAWLAWARRLRWIAIALGGWGFVVMAWMMVEPQLEDQRPFVVVTRDGVILREGNADSFLSRFDEPLVRGIEGTFLHRRGGWIQMALADGTVGWVPESAIVTIPESSP